MRRARAFLTALCLTLSGPGMAQTAAPTLAQVQAAAEAGQAEGQFALGMRYHAGQEVLQDYAIAADWFEKAAAQGFAPAQNMLGKYLFEGFGRDPDGPRAMALLEAAAQSGSAEFLFDLASLLERAPETLPRAAALYEQAAEAGFTEAAVSLGVLYQEGKGVEQDLDRARALYEPAAASGHPRAQNNLGLFYVRGEGVPQDYARAAELFRAAAEQGLKRAMTNLGVLYENGFGVPLDEELAAELYRMGGGQRTVSETEESASARFAYDPRLTPPDVSESGLKQLRAAAAAGDPVALFQLGWVLANSDDPSGKAFREAAALFRAAAGKGHPVAMRNLGLLYFEGQGVLQDFVLGHMWLLLAERGGAADARALNTKLSANLIPAQINESQQRAAAYQQN